MPHLKTATLLSSTFLMCATTLLIAPVTAQETDNKFKMTTTDAQKAQADPAGPMTAPIMKIMPMLAARQLMGGPDWINVMAEIWMGPMFILSPKATPSCRAA